MGIIHNSLYFSTLISVLGYNPSALRALRHCCKCIDHRGVEWCHVVPTNTELVNSIFKDYKKVFASLYAACEVGYPWRAPSHNVSCINACQQQGEKVTVTWKRASWSKALRVAPSLSLLLWVKPARSIRNSEVGRAPWKCCYLFVWNVTYLYSPLKATWESVHWFPLQ